MQARKAQCFLAFEILRQVEVQEVVQALERNSTRRQVAPFSCGFDDGSSPPSPIRPAQKIGGGDEMIAILLEPAKELAHPV
jgi:hypothetical protein